MEPNEELSLATKLKIVGAMALVSALIVVSTGVGVALQKENKLQAAELAKTQLVNVEAIKTSFPEFRDTEEFKESAKMAMVKISVDSLPATIEAGQADGSPVVNPYQGEGDWSVFDSFITVGDSAGSGIANNNSPNGWSVSEGGVISIPAGAEYGKYTVLYWGEDTDPENPMINENWYYYVFKITPPCPTSVTLTKAP